jgi:hypothetical protein
MAGVVAALDFPLPYFLEVLFAEDEGGGLAGALWHAPVLGAALAEEGGEGEEEGEGGEDEDDGAAPAPEEHDAGRACGGEVGGGRGSEEHAAAGGEEEGPVGDEDAEVAVADAGDGDEDGAGPGDGGRVGVRLALQLLADGGGQLAHPVHGAGLQVGSLETRLVAVLDVAPGSFYSCTIYATPASSAAPWAASAPTAGTHAPPCTAATAPVPPPPAHRQSLAKLVPGSTYLGRLMVLHQATQRPLRRTQGAVEHVDIHLPRLVLGLESTPHLQPPTLCAPSG